MLPQDGAWTVLLRGTRGNQIENQYGAFGAAADLVCGGLLVVYVSGPSGAGSYSADGAGAASGCSPLHRPGWMRYTLMQVIAPEKPSASHSVPILFYRTTRAFGSSAACTPTLPHLSRFRSTVRPCRMRLWRQSKLNRTAVGLTRPSTWMPGTRPGMTKNGGRLNVIGNRSSHNRSRGHGRPLALKLPPDAGSGYSNAPVPPRMGRDRQCYRYPG
jgi:hypothetical protein